MKDKCDICNHKFEKAISKDAIGDEYEVIVKSINQNKIMVNKRICLYCITSKPFIL